MLLLVLLLRDDRRLTGIPQRPALAPWYRVAGDDDRLVFEHAHRAVVLEGAAVRALLPRLLPLLDGTRTVDELAACLALPGEVVEHAVGVLATRQLLVDGTPAAVPLALREVAEQVAAACGAPPRHVAESLAAARIEVAGESRTADEVARLLSAAGIVAERRPLGESLRADVVVAAPTPAELPALEALDELGRTERLAWLQVLPFDGRFAAVGPLVLPGETACGTCYALRRGAALGFGEVEPVLAAEPPQATAGAIVEAVAAAVAALVVVRWVGARDPRSPGVLHAVEAGAELRITRHRVLRVPRCPACSPRLARPVPWFDPVGATP